MKHDREFWIRQVKDWRASGLTQAQFCRRHRLVKGTLGYWASFLDRPRASGAALVEIGRAETKPVEPRSPIELIVARRYLLRLWPETGAEHLRQVLSVLERGS